MAFNIPVHRRVLSSVTLTRQVTLDTRGILDAQRSRRLLKRRLDLFRTARPVLGLLGSLRTLDLHDLGARVVGAPAARTRLSRPVAARAGLARPVGTAVFGRAARGFGLGGMHLDLDGLGVVLLLFLT